MKTRYGFNNTVEVFYYGFKGLLTIYPYTLFIEIQKVLSGCV